MHFRYGLLLLLFLLAAGISVNAGTTGKIAGIATDKSTGEPLIGVNVVLEGTSLGSATDLDGTFIILNIPPGKYVVTAEYIGFANLRVEDVQVNVDLTTQLELVMQEATVEFGDVITVVAERELITKDLTASTARVDAERIESLPVTEVSEILELQGGYLNGNVRGGRSGEVAYWIDGVPVTDSYDGGQVVEVNTASIEQLQFISGAFNAEYGQALSGIVNITTKEPSESFGGNFTTYFGDYYSQNTDIFWNLDTFNPDHIRNFEGGIFGQIVPGKLSYYFNARHIYFGGRYFGQRVYNPHNISVVDSAGNYQQFRDPGGEGDGEFVPMNWNEKNYFQTKLIYNIGPLMKLTHTFIRDAVDYQDYDRAYKLNPDGDLNRFRKGNTNLLKLTHTINNSTFYEIAASYFDKSFDQYVYEDITDQRYVNAEVGTAAPFSFKTGGTNNQHFSRRTQTFLGKFDLTSQMSKRNLVKLGVEVRQNYLDFRDITLQSFTAFDPGISDPFIDPQVLPVNTPFHSAYNRQPFEFSAYIQDKMEFEDFILNIGMRIDHFRPDGVVLNDPSDPNIYNPLRPENRYRDLNGNGIQDLGEPFLTLEERRAYWYKDAGNKTQLSPRLGAAFPISETGVIHFSYGHFFQIPNFELLYRNPEFELGNSTGNQGTIGNADLRPEQTISGEIGLQQQLNDLWAIDVTAYFRDIRDLTGTRADEIVVFGGSQTYSKLVNSDFGFVKGFILSLEKRFSDGFNTTIDYTFQVADGTASDPNAAQQALAAGNQPEVQLVPLAWDQRHTLNGTFSFSKPTYGASFLWNLGSGQSYTPRVSGDVSELRENSRKKPLFFNVDMRLHKSLKVLDRDINLFLRVFNLFDRLNEVNVYNDTGRAGFTTELGRIRALNPTLNVNTLEEWFTDATFYSEPRRIEFGMRFGF